MKLEDQVCSSEYAKKLKELGVKQDSFFWYIKWIPPKGSSYLSSEIEWKLSIYKGSTDDREFISAFTVAELGEMLSYNVTSQKIYSSNDWVCRVYFASMDDTDDIREDFIGATEANARAKMLIWLIEDGHVKI